MSSLSCSLERHDKRIINRDGLVAYGKLKYLRLESSTGVLSA